MEAVSSEKLVVRNANASRTITFISSQDPANIGWKSPQLGVLHVIECSGKFVTFEEASLHLHTGRTYDQKLEFKKEDGVEIWDEGGAMKVLVASASSGVPIFDPGVHERDCRFQVYVLGCAPPKDLEKESYQNWDLGEYSRQVLKLLSKLRMASQHIAKLCCSRSCTLTIRRCGARPRWLPWKQSS